jgi:hypothetical protein
MGDANAARTAVTGIRAIKHPGGYLRMNPIATVAGIARV